MTEQTLDQVARALATGYAAAAGHEGLAGGWGRRDARTAWRSAEQGRVVHRLRKRRLQRRRARQGPVHADLFVRTVRHLQRRPLGRASPRAVP